MLSVISIFNSDGSKLVCFIISANISATSLLLNCIGLIFIETDIDSDGGDGGEMPFEIFTLRNLINFLLGFSWTGISFYQKFENKTILIVISIGVGLAFVAIFFFLIKQILKLSEDNSFKIESTIY